MIEKSHNIMHTGHTLPLAMAMLALPLLAQGQTAGTQHSQDSISSQPADTLSLLSDSTQVQHADTTTFRSDSLAHRADSLLSFTDSTACHRDSLLIASDSLQHSADTLSASSVQKAKSTVDSTQQVKRVKWRSAVDATAQRYGQQLTELIHQRDIQLATPASYKKPNAYSMRMVLPPIFYSSSVLQQFSSSWDEAIADKQIMSMYLVNDAFANMYVHRPDLVTHTDSELMQAGTLRDDVQQPLTTDTKLSDKVVTVNLDKELDEDVKLVTRKPNFWRFPGNGSLKFTQNYFSENWHKGGNNNYAMQAALTLRANYDNKQKIQWENTLELRLGFQTTGELDKYHSMKPTDNMMRLTTKLGYKAYKTLYYSTQVQATTQMVSAYDDNSNRLRTAFLAPLDMNISVGLDYKFNVKNGKFYGNVYVAPCAYNMRYVKHDELVGRYGVEKGKNSYHKFGPNITINHHWNIYKNISWHGRVFWVSDFTYTNLEWENTFNFTINKYLKATLFANPKFDDSSPSYKGDHGYIMMREWFSLGFEYSW